MERNLTVKGILIAAVLITLGIAMWPPGEKLNLGLDLRGGTSLLYQVTVPEGQDAQEVMRRTVQVLEDRVDPAGVRNLQWRIEAGNRIEVQMPLPTPDVVERRERYIELLEAVEEQNVRESELMAALRAGEEVRGDRLAALDRDVPGRGELLREAADAFDRLQAARDAYRDIEDTDERIEMAREVAEAEREFEAVVRDLLGTNLDRVEIGRVLELSDAPRRGDRLSHRAEELELLRERHPHRVEELNALIEAYDAYEAVKGPLDDPNDLIRLLRGAGVLEFRIAVTSDDAPDADELREQLQERGPRAQRGELNRRWFVVDDPASWADDEGELERLLDDPESFFRGRDLVATRYGEDIYLLLWDTPERSITQRDPGWQLTRASTGQDQQGMPAVNFQLNSVGASYMGRLTSDNMGEPMAIVLDGRVYSAPNIRGQIRSHGQITGRFSPAELEYLIVTLQAGALQATLSDEPIRVRTVGPTLGQDNLDRGLTTAKWAFVLIVMFMMIYYFFAGMVATAALLANLVIVLGVMSTLQAAFTLPGIAGIVLTIGMCVDANVLVFERIREELRRGADMPTSLRLGFQKALSAIIDGNVTNLIVVFVLGYFATAEVRGFAVTLGVGIVATLFTAVFMSRVIFTAYYHLFGAKKMHMLPTVFPVIDRVLTPSIRWVAQRRIYFGISIAVVILSLSLIGLRGEDILDIEFRGGTEVSFATAGDERLSLEEVRERLEQAGLPESTVVPLGRVDDQYRATEFSILTTNPVTDEVTRIVQGAFSDVLDVQPSVQFEGSDLDDPMELDIVHPVDDASLGQVINEPAIEDDVSEHMGGVAVVLRDLSPSLTLADVERRIQSMRLQPDYEHLQFRPRPQVVGLEADPENPERFTSIVVVTSDPDIHYADDPAQWEQDVAATEWSLVRDSLTRETSLASVSNFTPAVARTMAQAAIVALILAIVAIIAYIWFRFGSLRYSLAAIAALFHDVLITLGLVAASAFLFNQFEPLAQLLLIDPFKINMALIAALLTIIGYSLNDTIVIFDRIRENRGKLAFATPAIINRSINQTISRTVITSGTTFLAVSMLYVFGGEGIRGFAFALCIGVIVGTYSSIAVAASLLLVGAKVRDEDPAEAKALVAEAETGADVRPRPVG